MTPGSSPTHPTPAVKFECACPECGGALLMQSATEPQTRTTSGIFECVECGVTVRISVSMRLCDARRYDVAPLLEHLGVDDVEAARVLDVDRRTLIYYRRCGLSDATADRLATSLSMHPSAIWPQWWPEEVSA